MPARFLPRSSPPNFIQNCRNIVCTMMALVTCLQFNHNIRFLLLFATGRYSMLLDATQRYSTLLDATRCVSTAAGVQNATNQSRLHVPFHLPSNLFCQKKSRNVKLNGIKKWGMMSSNIQFICSNSDVYSFIAMSI
jgi:hypothetical protein